MADPRTLDALIAEHQGAMLAWHQCDDDQWQADGDEIGRRVDKAIAALLAHRPATLIDVRRKASFMAGDQTFTEWDDTDVEQIIRSLIPVEASPCA